MRQIYTICQKSQKKRQSFFYKKYKALSGIGRKIEQIAGQKGFKPADLANSIGVSVNYVYKLYKSAHINTELLEKLSAAFSVPMVAFFQEDALPSNVTQSGAGNIIGSGNRQQITTGAESTGRTASSTSTEELAAKLADCQKDKSFLERELEVTRQLVKSKDEMILLLRGSLPSN